LDPAAAAPVILGFHGGFGSPQDFAHLSDLPARAGRTGFVVVLPEGYRRSWNAGDCCGPAQRRRVDDVAFVKALLNDLASVVNVDPRRVFAIGFSNGGKFSYHLACELSDRIAAIAPVACSIGASTCKPTRPVPVLHFHGTIDQFAPFKGGIGAYRRTGMHTAVLVGIETFVNQNGCTQENRVTFKRRGAMCLTYSICRDGAEVTLCTIEGMGHQWPGGKEILPRLLGPGTDDISATDMLLTFFQRHPMPADR
jgi:polyhydroxybutyrate depolymerase